MITTGGGKADRPGRLIFNATYTYWADAIIPNSYLYTYCKINNSSDYQTFQKSISNGDRILIDSGAHVFYQRKIRAGLLSSHDREYFADDDMFQYFDNYCNFLLKYEQYLWGYIELDLGTQEQKTDLRNRMNARGLYPIPVYHASFDTLDYLDSLASRHDRICFGNIATEDKQVRDIVVQIASFAKKNHPHLWVHLLGIAPDSTLAAYPGIDSIDTTTSSSIARFGHFDEGSCFSRRYGVVDDFRNRRKDRPSTELAFWVGFRSYQFHSIGWNRYHSMLDGAR